ncbi:MAG: tRNA pseudouridine(38-40) synthase TruA [Proteobacteria bacterium]|nr:tRNA pseudouridine(38-40) synthase TruA [Pseudomonadota bacterium]MBW3617015.1 tRNA pseudouridine(38-40) synthase TruA [Pseudomonadota bacterium]
MPRYKLTLEYDGGPFVGWQAQANGPSVQAALQAAVHAFSGEAVTVTGAGRTDTGVHAHGQVAHLDLSRDWPPRTVREAVNAHLWPQPVAVLEAEPAAEDFHARFSATGRRYLFRILDRRAPPALLRGRVWHVRKPLDAALMAEAAATLIGRHDFTTFRDAHCQAESPVRTLDQLEVRREGEEIHLRFAARSFLHRQVRSITGSLAEVGAGRWPPDDVRQALDARDRAACGPVAPPEGLYLTAVTY